MSRLSLPGSSRTLLSVALLAAAAACRESAPRVTAHPPAAEFVLAAGDSSYWVTSEGGDVQLRGAPLELARIGRRFYELYVVDDDRSYEDAVLLGQRIYRRDLLSGDSLLVFEDTIVPRLAATYHRLHPDDERLGPDDDASDDPLWRATTTVDLVDLQGPFLSFTLHADVERDDHVPWHTSRRGVIDLETGRPASLARVAGGNLAPIREHRTVAAAAILDSVRSGGDRIDRARTEALLHAYRLEPDGFTLTTVDGQPAVEYALSGSGGGEAGQLLELPPIPIGEPNWWRDAAPTLPVSSADRSRDVWRRGRYEVVARHDPGSTMARLLLRDSTSREWLLGRVPLPAIRIFWLDDPPIDSLTRRALDRAFDESGLYDEAARSTAVHRRAAHRPAGAPSRPASPGRPPPSPARGLTTVRHDPSAPKTPRASEAVVADLMMPHQANGLRRPSVFGGVIMSMVDRCAALSAMRHAGGQATTLSIDRILFKEPIHVGELVEVRSRVVQVGRTSMSVLANVYAEHIATGKRRHTNECWLTFVHLDQMGNPAPVPRLILETDEDRALHAQAAARREAALAELRAAE